MDDKLDVPPANQQDESEYSDCEDQPLPYRRDSESSTERSLYEDKDLAEAGSSGAVHEYGWYHPRTMSRGLVVTDQATSTPTSKFPLYYCEVSEFALKKPDITLHAVSPPSGAPNDLDYLANMGESGPVLGVCILPKLSRQIKVGIGDPAAHGAMTWVEVANPNRAWHGEYVMSLQGQSYAWQRTHDAAAGVEGGRVQRHVTRNSYQLIDQNTHEVVAVFLVNKFKSWKKKGKLRIFRDLEGSSAEARQFKLLVFLSIAGIIEKARRRAHRRYAAHGGGGGP